MVITAEPAAKPDTVLIQAVDLARAAAIEEAGEQAVGDYVGVEMDEERVATHSFACANPAYVGWRWAVTLARATRARSATVSQVVLLPGPESIVAPAWIPWSERVKPGDLGVGDVLPTSGDDPRLVPGYVGRDAAEGLAEEWELRPTQWELGLGRARVLSVHGRDEAAERWQRGETGPNAAMARQASLTCSTCGFLVTVGGALGQAFGMCANAFGAADGRVVALTFGCGAHSEVVVDVVPDEDAPGGAMPGSSDPLPMPALPGSDDQSDVASGDVDVTDGQA